jgi:hypothetical protein
MSESDCAGLIGRQLLDSNCETALDFVRSLMPG